MSVPYWVFLEIKCTELLVSQSYDDGTSAVTNCILCTVVAPCSNRIMH